ncbi:MAG: heavy metal translocating P-type ATPase [Pseudanabaenaceae cyanobacterium]
MESTQREGLWVPQTWQVDGMRCGGCAAALERRLAACVGVHAVSVNFLLGQARVLVPAADAEALSQSCQEAIAAAGFTVVPPTPIVAPQPSDDRSALAIALGLVGLALVGHLGMMGLPAVPMLRNLWVHGAIATVALVGPGRVIWWEGWRAFWRGAPTMDSLVGLGMVTAYGASLTALLVPAWHWHCFFEEPVMLLGFVLLGRTLEQRARRRAMAAIAHLETLQPATARLVVGEATVTVPATALQPGDRIVVWPSERIPVDGEIEAGQAEINEALLTGEALPVTRGPGEPVVGGTLTLNGALTIRATRVGEQTTLGQIAAGVARAQTHKFPVQRLVDRVAGVFAYGVMALALATLGGWLWAGASPLTALAYAIAVLVVACPCALGLATPSALAVGTGLAAERGILVTAGEVLERVPTLNGVVLDKTGTLTAGQLTVVAVAGDRPDWVLTLAATAERENPHPIAQAIAAAATPLPSESPEVFVGQGVRVRLEGNWVAVGSPTWLESLGVTVDDPWHETLADWGRCGYTGVLVSWQNQVVGALALGDRLRPEAKATVATLQQRYGSVWMLTGDRRETALTLAQELGIPASHVMAEVSPTGKAEAIAALQQAGYRVAFVGDGANDGPALATATVGIALGSGTDVAATAAGLVVWEGGLTGVVTALTLGQATFAKIRQNLVWAIAYNLIALPAAAGLWGNAWGPQPVLAGLAMAFSSTSVVVNALSLRWGYRP